MFDILKLTIGIVILAGLLLAVPIFAGILGAGLALVVLYHLLKDYREQEKNVREDSTD